MTKQEFEILKGNIINEAKLSCQTYPELRYGQSIYNTSYKLLGGNLKTFKDITIDCFYNDNQINTFFSALEKELT